MNIKPRSIMTVPIIGVSYKVKKQTTICKIKWLNPCNGNKQVTYGIATCNPDDEFIPKIGERLSESRAKIKMYDEYRSYLGELYVASMQKHANLIQKEAEHQLRIKPSK